MVFELGLGHGCDNLQAHGCVCIYIIYIWLDGWCATQAEKTYSRSEHFGLEKRNLVIRGP